MKRIPMKRRVTATVLSLALTLGVCAQDTSAQLPHYSKTPAELSASAPTGGAGGSGNAKVTVVTILGNPSTPGPYAELLEVAAHAQIPSHFHAGDRIGTVLSGTWYFGYGSVFDKSALKTLPPGSVYTEPSGAAHYAATGEEPVVVLITGRGPTSTVYENPSDDPANKHR